MASDLLYNRVVDDLDLGVCGDPVLHDLARPERVSAVDQIDLAGVLGEIVGFFHRGVSAPDDNDFFASEEKAVTCGAGAYSEASERDLAGQSQPFGARAGGNDNALGFEHFSVCPHFERAPAEVDLRYLSVVDLRSKAFGLFSEKLHDLRAHDPVWESRIVLHVGGDHKLAAGLNACENERFEVGSGVVQSGGISGRPRADDDDVVDHSGG